MHVFALVCSRARIRVREEDVIILPAQQIGAAVAPWPSAITSVDDMAHKGKGK